VDHTSWGKDSGAGQYFSPGIVLEELGASLQHKKPFVLVRVIVRRRASAWRSDSRKHGVLAAGFCAAKVDGDFVAKSPNDFTARRRNDTGGWNGFLIHFMKSSVSK
jgi:hypothetical protein